MRKINIFINSGEIVEQFSNALPDYNLNFYNLSQLGSISNHLADLVILDSTDSFVSDKFNIKKVKQELDWQKLVIVQKGYSQAELIEFLKIGVDAFMTKPLHQALFKARIDSLINRNTLEREIKLGEMMINYGERKIKYKDKDILLRKKEIDILIEMARSSGRVVSRDKLNTITCNRMTISDTNTVDVHISKIRKIFRENGIAPKIISTVHGLGYRMDLKYLNESV